MFKFLRKTALWILLAPGAMFGGGVLSNQAVLIANHDKFPVMWNEYKVNSYAMQLDEIAHGKDKTSAKQAQFDLDALDAGYLDDTHCLMTPKTHLNWLGDIWDLRDAGSYSVGDAMIYLGEWAMGFAFAIWIFEAIRRLRQE